VEQFSELTGDEAAELGSIVREASTALSSVLGCLKTYVVSYGEQPGFEHLHLHVVPRMADFEAHQAGSGVFQFLKCPESEWLAPAERDQLAVALAGHWLGSTRV
jgi:diadenosine tetraphosphate (Ap4A) HIT family hydrolase